MQLLALGLDRNTITRRIKAGELIPVHWGVYAVGHAPIEPRARAHAAVLACGPGALLSHSSAAVLWGLRKRWEEPFQVTVPRERRQGRIITHICGKLARPDKRVQYGIPATSPARTVLDITPRLAERALLRMLSDGRHAGYLHLDSLRDVISRNPRHPGAKPLKALVEDAPEIRRARDADQLLAGFARCGSPSGG